MTLNNIKNKCYILSTYSGCCSKGNKSCTILHNKYCIKCLTQNPHYYEDCSLEEEVINAGTKSHLLEDFQVQKCKNCGLTVDTLGWVENPTKDYSCDIKNIWPHEFENIKE